MSKQTIVVFNSAQTMDAQREFLESSDIALIALDDLDVDTLLGYVKIASNEFCKVYELVNHHRQWYSRNIVECFEKGNFYRFSYACEHGLLVMNSATSIVANKFLEFSNSCGYYDSDCHAVMDYELHDSDDIVILHDGEKCHIDNAFFIDEIKSYVSESDAVYSDRYGRHILETDAVEVSGHGYVLNNDDDFFCCSSCNEYYHIDAYAEDGECENCHRENSSITSSAREYSTDVVKILGFGDEQNLINGKGVFVGIELECKYDEFKEEYKDDLYLCEKSGYAIPTQDASLDSALGVEFVFKPDNFDNYQSHIDSFIDDYHGLEKNAGDGYGLHIHVSNHFLSESAKVRIQNFVEMFECNFRKIGGRTQTVYQKAKNAGCKVGLKNGNKSKYQMVNILPAKTIEFRFPKSIVKSEHILLNIELAHAITMYCYSNFHIFIMQDFNNFVQFVVQNKKEYKHLNAYFSKA